MTGRRAVTTALLSALMLTVVAVVLIAQQTGWFGRAADSRYQTPDEVTSALDAPVADPVTALFVGDSYTAGTAGVQPGETFAPLACDALRWSCEYDAQGGTGYLADGKENAASFSRYAGRLAGHEGLRIDVLVVTGGRNDTGKTGVRAAAVAYLGALRQQFPRARLIVVEPFWHTSTAPEEVRRLRDDVRAAALESGALWIPSADWLSPSVIAGDGVHPNHTGHQRLAGRLTTAVKAALDRGSTG